MVFNYEKITDTSRAVFLLFIVIISNHLGDTLNCNIQNDLKKSKIIKNIFLYLFIVFTIDFTSKESKSILYILKKSLIIFIFYILIGKQNYITFYIIIILLICIYLIYLQTNYLKQHNEDTKYYHDITKYLIYGVSSIIIIGFFKYLFDEYKLNNNFNFLEIMFNKNICNMKN